MHIALRLALVALAACLPLSALAQTALPNVLNGTQIKTANATVIFDPTGAPLGTTANPMKITCTSGCSSTGGSVTISGTPTVNLGTAPSLAISTLPALPTGANTIGSVTISGTPSVALTGALPGFASTPAVTISGTPSFTCVGGCGGGGGGAVTQSGTWSVGLSGTLPGFATTPTFNIGTAPNLAIASLPALPSGSNTIGAIANTGFAITGTLPGFASTPAVTISGTPSVNLGTTDSGNLASAVSALNTAVTTLSSQLTTLNNQYTALSSLVSSIAAPINAQTTHGVNIGGVEGVTTAGSAGTYPVTVQGNAGGVPMPVTVGNAVTVYPAMNSTGTVSQAQSDSSAAINVSTATTTTLVALVAGKSIYVTAWDIVVAAADNVTLEYGTGTNCGTGTTALTGAYSLAANGGLARGSGLGVLFKVPAGNALCLVTSAAVQASGSVSYAQF